VATGTDKGVPTEHGRVIPTRRLGEDAFLVFFIATRS
jgi:hypothetical protein